MKKMSWVVIMYLWGIKTNLSTSLSKINIKNSVLYSTWQITTDSLINKYIYIYSLIFSECGSLKNICILTLYMPTSVWHAHRS
jgi:hypothetical protein